ncbi:VOC family protein [Bradyrhizobium canariense]|uniref:VOC family protein n=1 Tax=Bradyrhizobium canariense TaxID=255045 RepID=UPI0018E94901
MSTTSSEIVKFSVEVITLPARDIDRALRFYVDQVGFALDVDYAPNDSFRVVQLTPPRSGCSIQITKGPSDALSGSLRNIYLVVTNLEAARRRLLERGVEVSAIRHKFPIDSGAEGLLWGSTLRAGTTLVSLTSRTQTEIVGCCRNGVTAIRRELLKPEPVASGPPLVCCPTRTYRLWPVPATNRSSRASLKAETKELEEGPASYR